MIRSFSASAPFGAQAFQGRATLEPMLDAHEDTSCAEGAEAAWFCDFPGVVTPGTPLLKALLKPVAPAFLGGGSVSAGRVRGACAAGFGR
jgi:hypothetical protein